ncbi:hypothetical protein CFP56_024876 [Quercus suber]|uniref:Uncharacterized protein n=1 Tax=Quercus suber TaxID=58331 RepID=A0AAW0K4W7_QUESU
MPPNPCFALLPLTKPKKLEEVKATATDTSKATDDVKVKNCQIFHLSLPICRCGGGFDKVAVVGVGFVTTSVSGVGQGGGGVRGLKVERERHGRLTTFNSTLMSTDLASGLSFLEGSDQELVERVAADHRWVILVSLILRKLIAFFAKPMEWTGYALDFFLNLLSLNHNLFGLLSNLLQGT